MIGRGVFLLSVLLSPSPFSDGEGGNPPSIRWEVDPSGSTSAVSVVGLGPDALKALGDPAWTAERLAGLFSVAIEAGGANPADRPKMLGSYQIVDEALRFTPRYPFDRGRTYQATFQPASIPGNTGPVVASRRLIPKPSRPATIVTQVAPTGDLVPENLLKFYLYFSAPMSRGEVYDRVRLLKPDGTPVDLPFLRLAEELWDPTGTRLTLLIDPGRIKRGLRPREENGPVLEAGRTYTLTIDKAWRDAEGEPLGVAHRKVLRAGPADEAQPDPKTWKIAHPAAATREPLTITSPEPLDRALFESALNLVDAGGDLVDGKLAIGDGETTWKFTPERPWAENMHELLIDADLEDLAGNSILRPFEVDVQRDTPLRPERKIIRLSIKPGPKRESKN